MAVVRGEESEERRAQRQEGDWLRHIEIRQNESQEQRAQQLASNNHRYIAIKTTKYTSHKFIFF